MGLSREKRWEIARAEWKAAFDAEGEVYTETYSRVYARMRDEDRGAGRDTSAASVPARRERAREEALSHPDVKEAVEARRAAWEAYQVVVREIEGVSA